MCGNKAQATKMAGSELDPAISVKRLQRLRLVDVVVVGEGVNGRSEGGVEERLRRVVTHGQAGNFVDGADRGIGSVSRVVAVVSASAYDSAVENQANRPIIIGNAAARAGGEGVDNQSAAGSASATALEKYAILCAEAGRQHSINDAAGDEVGAETFKRGRRR